MLKEYCKATKLLRSILLNRRVYHRLLTDEATVSADSAQKIDRSDEFPGYVPENGKSDDKTGNGKTDDGRPFIFLWSRDQPATGKGFMVHLPKCDVVYKDEATQKKTRRKPERAPCHYLSRQSTENEILKYYLRDGVDLQQSSSVFCVYNPGESTLPEKLIEAKAQRVVVLEDPKSPFLDKWKAFTTATNEDAKKIVVPYNFNRLAAGRVRDSHNGRADSVRQALIEAGAVSRANENTPTWWGEETNYPNDPPVRIIGVAEPFKEHGLFATLLYTRITRSSIYEFGPVEVIAAVTAQQYLDLHRLSAGEEKAKTIRGYRMSVRIPGYRVPKLVHWRARLYNFLFEISPIAEDSMDSFSPEIPVKKHLKYAREIPVKKYLQYARGGVNETLYQQLGIDKDKMYWVSLRPRKCDELENLVSQHYTEQSGGELSETEEADRRRQFPHLAGFTYMYKMLSRCPNEKWIWEFTRNYFPEADRKALMEVVDLNNGVADLKLHDFLQLYNQLASTGGTTFYRSPFYQEVEQFVDQILCPTAVEPKTRGMKRM